LIKKLRWFLPILVAILGIFTLVAPVLASIPQPTDLEIQEVAAYENAQEDGDQLYLITYYIDFEELPSDDADELFLFRLLDAADDEIALVRPYPYNDRGYGLGVVAFYLEPDEVPAWESHVSIQLIGDPLADWAGGLPGTITDVITWETGATAGIQNLIAAKILSLAVDLGQAWDVVMTETIQGTTALSSAGSAYFLRVVPYLMDTVPSVVGQYILTPDYPDDKPESETWADQLQNSIDGTIFDLSGPARSLGTSRGALIATFYYGLAVVFLILLINRHKFNKGIMLLAWLFVIGGIFIGVPLVITIVGGFLCLISTVWVIYKGAY